MQKLFIIGPNTQFSKMAKPKVKEIRGYHLSIVYIYNEPCYTHDLTSKTTYYTDKVFFVKYRLARKYDDKCTLGKILPFNKSKRNKTQRSIFLSNK